ncbi:NAD(P)H-dependent oxidoreductase [uncultured Algimonas sp.]|uniref:FMN-dependent NADH-azoreductase n=1 Tax=uncultured Algimonas sp. TaxID=1547920 RepID=UPI002634C001|nr:NAD(P)H-dependent oxidoreductase [uncultured Algimonas sp.]
MTQPLNILRIDSSALQDGSVTRGLTDLYIDNLAKTGPVRVETRDVSEPLPVVTPAWIRAAHTAPEGRTAEDRAAIAISETLIGEIERSDVLVIGAPVYNFTIPASLKLWIDQIVFAGRTFRYGEQGFEGLLHGKRAVVLLASGGTEMGSEVDFLTPYMRFILGFIGITDVEIVAADALKTSPPDKLQRTQEQVRALAA